MMAMQKQDPRMCQRSKRPARRNFEDRLCCGETLTCDCTPWGPRWALDGASSIPDSSPDALDESRNAALQVVVAIS
jgi:hypothetical protein